MDLTKEEYECLIEKTTIALHNCEMVNKELHIELRTMRTKLKILEGDLMLSRKECCEVRQELEAVRAKGGCACPCKK